MKALVPEAHRSPLVALVGRPNVGKSTLFNRLVGRRQALMHDQPGVTRDRIFGKMAMDDLTPSNSPIHDGLRLVDTGGLVDPDQDPLFAAMMVQTHAALADATVIVHVVDGQAGLLPYDTEIARMLRRLGKPVILAVNKVDIGAHEATAHDFYPLGAKTLIALSAEHNRQVTDLREAILEQLISLDARLMPQAPAPAAPEEEDASVALWAEADAAHRRLAEGAPDDDFGAADTDTDAPAGSKTSQVEWSGGPIKVAVVGRPNVGKSSLINAILGQARLVASPLPGTTRDAVDTSYVHEGQEYVLIDTAGIRRQRAISDRLESLTVNMAFDSMDRADVVVLVLDGVQRPTDQDAKIAAMAQSKGVGVVVVASKWDLVENPEWKEKFVDAIRHDLPFIDYAPVVKTSAVTSRGLSDLFAQIVRVQEERHRRVSTGELNRFFKEVVQTHPPPGRKGKRPHLFFVSQPLVRPPTFVFASRGADALARSYQRYLANSLRRRYGFDGTPLWLKFRESSRR
jgi:GTP-binding protein